MSKYELKIPEWKKKVKQLCELEDGMSPPELSFVESLSHRSMGQNLSPAQQKWLDTIYERLIG